MKCIHLLVGFLFLLALPPIAGQEPVFTLDLDADPVIADASGQISNIDVAFVSDAANETLGLELFYSFDPTLLHVFGMSSLLADSPSFFAVEYLNEDSTHPTTGVVTPAGVGLLGCVFDFGLVNTITTAPGVPVPVLRISVIGGPGVFPGATSDLTFQNGLTVPVGGTTHNNSMAWRVDPTTPPQDTLFDLTSATVPLSFVVPMFGRGDVSGDGSLNLVDAILTLEHLFLSNPVACPAAADVDANGTVAILDAITFLNYLFLNGPPPNSIACSPQDTHGLSCDTTTCP